VEESDDQPLPELATTNGQRARNIALATAMAHYVDPKPRRRRRKRKGKGAQEVPLDRVELTLDLLLFLRESKVRDLLRGRFELSVDEINRYIASANDLQDEAFAEPVERRRERDILAFRLLAVESRRKGEFRVASQALHHAVELEGFLTADRLTADRLRLDAAKVEGTALNRLAKQDEMIEGARRIDEMREMRKGPH
jgi:hypothetical protein